MRNVECQFLSNYRYILRHSLERTPVANQTIMFVIPFSSKLLHSPSEVTNSDDDESSRLADSTVLVFDPIYSFISIEQQHTH